MECLLIERQQKEIIMKDTKPNTVKHENWDKIHDKAIALTSLNPDYVLMMCLGQLRQKKLWDKLSHCAKLNLSSIRHFYRSCML